jgi:MoaA/NifB/PqqE/SkfB family radical SAM enzyme
LPVWGQLNITWLCNLACVYCNQYDNTRGHVAFDVLAQRIDHAAELGCLDLHLLGGEPLLHPDVVRLTRRIRERRMTTGVTTNGFLLTQPTLEALIDAGLGRLQISIDAARPTAGIPKTLKTLSRKIQMAAAHSVRTYVNAVLCSQTLDQVEEIATFCFDHGVSVSFSVVHDRGRLRMTDADVLLRKLDWLDAQRRAGKPVHTTSWLSHYYRRALQGRPFDWVCQAGAKCFYVDADGTYHFCYDVSSGRQFLTIRREDLAGFRTRKGCESNCGVDCMVQTSMVFSNPLRVLAAEAKDRLVRVGVR